jgi:two-component system chemotaxis sensor kinase CheA
MNDTSEIISEFLAESREHLDQLESDLVELEKNPTSSELIDSIFRAVHTIKGACGFLAFSRLEALIQAEETLLSQVRSGQQRLSLETVILLLAASDRTRAVLSEVEATGRDGQGEDPELIERLADYTIPLPSSDSPNEEADKPLGQLLIETAVVSPGAVKAALGAQKEETLVLLGRFWWNRERQAGRSFGMSSNTKRRQGPKAQPT